MPEVYLSPGGGTSYPVFQTDTHADQIGVNGSPDNNLGTSRLVSGTALNSRMFM